MSVPWTSMVFEILESVMRQLTPFRKRKLTRRLLEALSDTSSSPSYSCNMIIQCELIPGILTVFCLFLFYPLDA